MTRTERFRLPAAGLLAAALLLPLWPALAGPPPGFERDVLPLLASRCLKCHGAFDPKAGLDLRTAAAILRGGLRGPAVAPGAPDRSLLIRRVRERTMPPAGEPPLSAGEVRLLASWIAGLPAAPAARGSAAAPHWAFVPPRRPALPAVRNRAWVRTPVDAFVLARLERAGLPAPPPADRLTLLRRVTLDLTGLPPTPEEQQAFLADGAPDAYERVVDGLLARPAYAERWARHWLDVVRYAETNGYERDGTKPHAWRYRDYVVDSLHRDKPFDRFLMEQVAGDELPGSNAEAQIAATFLRLGTWDDEPAEPEQDRCEQLDDMLGTTATAFLGVTLRCARCHDHKFEPFAQREYYQFLSVFQPLRRPQEGRNDLDRLVGTAGELAAYREAAARADAQAARLQAELERLEGPVREALFQAGRTSIPADAVAAFRAEPSRRTPAQANLVRQHREKLDGEVLEAAGETRGRIETLRREIAAVPRPPEPPRAYIWYEEGPEAPPTRILDRGDPARPGEVVGPALPAVLAPRPPAPPVPLAASSGRRLWLARWMVSPENPLVARVLVNRVWQGHFGEGLVATENDFGVMGARPTHPEQLDWLAVEFSARQPESPPGSGAAPTGAMGWSLKALHRLIVRSSVYRASAAWRPEMSRRDPDGALLSRWKPRRLEAEAVRDSILAASGQLNPERGGPSIYPTLPRAVLEGQSRPGLGWGASDARQAARRSLYIFSKRSLAVPELEVLDAPDTTSSCEQRPTSTIAPQALTFLNGEFIQEQSRRLAERLQREAGADPAAQVRRAFELVVARPPAPAELRAGLEFLAGSPDGGGKQDDTSPAGRGLASFALVMLNLNEFVYLQ